MTIMIVSFFLAVIAVTINGITQLFYARTLGFKLKPTGFAYFIGAAGSLLTGNVVPISGQAETLTVAGLMKDLHVRVAALLLAAVVGVVLGLTHTISMFVDFAGEIVIVGMMAGVGMILSEVSITFVRQNLRVGIISFIVAIATWFITHDLVYTISFSVFLSTLDYLVFTRRQEAHLPLPTVEPIEWRFWKKQFWGDFHLVSPKFTLTSVIGALGIVCLNIGTNISFGTITSSLANETPRLDTLTVINSMADIPSIVFGGVPIEAIISGTAAAPWPLLAGVSMMTLSGIFLLVGVIERIAHLIPAQSITGFLFVIGFNLTLIPNLMKVASSDVPLEGIVTASITLLTKNAFLGVIAGISIRLFGTVGGLI